METNNENKIENQNETPKNDKKNKKVVKAVVAAAVGVAALLAAVAVPTGIILSNQGYSVKITSESEDIEDYDISLKGKTKIEDLKKLLKPVVGFTVEGLYKDQNLTQRFDDEEVLEKDTIIYINYIEASYTVTFYDADKTTVLDKIENVKHYDKVNITNPTKTADKVGSYTFIKWVDFRGNDVDLKHVMQDLELYAVYKIDYIEYKITAIPEQVTIKRGGVELTTNDTLHYGERLDIKYTETEGYHKTNFKVNGADQMEDTKLYLVNGELSVEYAEEINHYVMGDIPSQVTIKRDGEILSSGAVLTHGDVIEIKYTETPGYEKTAFEVSGCYPLGNDQYGVSGDVTVSYEEEKEITYLTYELNANGNSYDVVGYNGSETKIRIPNKYNGKPVAGIRGNTFNGCENLTEVKIEEGVTSIGEAAFMYCENLTSITIPSSVTIIGNNAFFGCSLTSIMIPNSVTIIGDSAFQYCSLTSITIPSSVTSIGSYAFRYCYNLTSVTIEEGVTSIGDYVFEGCNNLTSVTIPNSVTSIREGTFSNCSGLTSITIPSSVTSIGPYAFSWCSGLTSVTIPSSVTSIGERAFSNCSSLTSVTIESATIYNAGNVGNLLDNATRVRVLKTIVDDTANSNSYLASNYTRTEDGDYYLFTK